MSFKSLKAKQRETSHICSLAVARADRSARFDGSVTWLGRSLSVTNMSSCIKLQRHRPP